MSSKGAPKKRACETLSATQALGFALARTRNRLSALVPMAKSLHTQIIARALELISEETHWTRCALARKKDWTICDWNDQKAFSYCAVGALARVAADLVGSTRQAFSLYLAVARHVLGANGRAHECLPTINDQEGHVVILAMFRKALVL